LVAARPRMCDAAGRYQLAPALCAFATVVVAWSLRCRHRRPEV